MNYIKIKSSSIALVCGVFFLNNALAGLPEEDLSQKNQITIGGIKKHTEKSTRACWRLSEKNEITINTDGNTKPDFICDGFSKKIDKDLQEIFDNFGKGGNYFGKIESIIYEHVLNFIPSDGFSAMKKLVSLLPSGGKFEYQSYWEELQKYMEHDDLLRCTKKNSLAESFGIKRIVEDIVFSSIKEWRKADTDEYIPNIFDSYKVSSDNIEEEDKKSVEKSNKLIDTLCEEVGNSLGNFNDGENLKTESNGKVTVPLLSTEERPGYSVAWIEYTRFRFDEFEDFGDTLKKYNAKDPMDTLLGKIRGDWYSGRDQSGDAISYEMNDEDFGDFTENSDVLKNYNLFKDLGLKDIKVTFYQKKAGDNNDTLYSFGIKGTVE